MHYPTTLYPVSNWYRVFVAGRSISPWWNVRFVLDVVCALLAPYLFFSFPFVLLLCPDLFPFLFCLSLSVSLFPSSSPYCEGVWIWPQSTDVPLVPRAIQVPGETRKSLPLLNVMIDTWMRSGRYLVIICIFSPPTVGGRLYRKPLTTELHIQSWLSGVMCNPIYRTEDSRWFLDPVFSLRGAYSSRYVILTKS